MISVTVFDHVAADSARLSIERSHGFDYVCSVADGIGLHDDNWEGTMERVGDIIFWDIYNTLCPDRD